MLMILIAIIVLAVVSVILFFAGEDDYGFKGVLCGIFGFIFAIAAGISAITYASLVYDWIASESKANIINREYGTKYTQKEVFYASDVIDTVRQLDRKRIEINGDLMRKEACEKTGG